MVMARLLITSVVIIALVLIGLGDIAIPTIQAYDPPSIYNYGRGGYSELVHRLRVMGYEFDSIDNIAKLRFYEPSRWILIIASPDRDINDREADEILSWVSSGGRVAILNELGTTDSILSRFGIYLGRPGGGVETVRCTIDGKEYDVIYNIYSPMRINNEPGHRVNIICGSPEYILGVSIDMDSVIVIPDSSIAINEVLLKGYGDSSLAFLLSIARGRGILFYEGGREYLVLRTSYLLKALMIIPSILSYMVNTAYAHGALAISIMISVIFVFASFILASSLGMGYSSRRRGVSKYSTKDIISRGAERWRRLAR